MFCPVSLTHAEPHSATTAGLRMNKAHVPHAELQTIFNSEIIGVQPARAVTVFDNCNVLLCVEAHVRPLQSVVWDRNTLVLCSEKPLWSVIHLLAKLGVTTTRAQAPPLW